MSIVVDPSKKGRTRILLHDAVLKLLEALTCGVSPPLLKLSFLVVQSASGIKGMLKGYCQLGHELNQCDAHSQSTRERQLVQMIRRPCTSA